MMTIDLIKTKYFQVWINPSWRILFMIEVYHGITFRFGRLMIHCFGKR